MGRPVFRTLLLGRGGGRRSGSTPVTASAARVARSVCAASTRCWARVTGAGEQHLVGQLRSPADQGQVLGVVGRGGGGQLLHDVDEVDDALPGLDDLRRLCVDLVVGLLYRSFLALSPPATPGRSALPCRCTGPHATMVGTSATRLAPGVGLLRRRRRPRRDAGHVPASPRILSGSWHLFERGLDVGSRLIELRLHAGDGVGGEPGISASVRCPRGRVVGVEGLPEMLGEGTLPRAGPHLEERSRPMCRKSSARSLKW